MIIGHLNALPLAGLPPVLRAILERPDCSLTALTARDDGRWQPQGCPWFCHIGPAQTQPQAERHTEYHYLYADIQVVLAGSHVICAVTGKAIPVDELRYWSVVRQEPYVDAAASLEAEKRAGALPNQRR